MAKKTVVEVEEVLEPVVDSIVVEELVKTESVDSEAVLLFKKSLVTDINIGYSLRDLKYRVLDKKPEHLDASSILETTSLYDFVEALVKL